MKKIKFLAFFALVALCFSMLAFKTSNTNNAYASQTLSTETIDVGTLVTDKVITDSTKKYILTGTAAERTITFVNDSLLEKTFYVTIEHLYISTEEMAPLIVIQDNGHKTTVNFCIKGYNEIAGTSNGAIMLRKYFDEEHEVADNAEIVVNFSTDSNGTLELKSVKDNLKSPTFLIQENVNASINLSSHSTKLTAFAVNSTTYDTFEEGIAEASKDASKIYCKMSFERADTVQNKIEFHMMGHGTQVDSVFLDETQTKFTPTKLSNVDGLVFYGWYKDVTLNHKWNPKTDTVTEDMTLYAGWFIPGPETPSEDGKLPVWAIVLISVSSFVILLGNAYVIVYFCAYKKGKLNNKFFNLIYKPFANNKPETKQPIKTETKEKAEKKKDFKKAESKNSEKIKTQKTEAKTKENKKENAKEPKAETKEKTQSKNNDSKKESLNKNTKNNANKSKQTQKTQTKTKKQLNKKSK